MRPGAQTCNATWEVECQRRSLIFRGRMRPKSLPLGDDIHDVHVGFRLGVVRHAPGFPVIVVESTDTEAVEQVFRAERWAARPGDIVLLERGGSSRHMRWGYDAKGDVFAAAVRFRHSQTG